MSEISSLVARYRNAAAATSEESPEVHNAHVRELHRCYQVLRTSDAGRAAISDLMDDTSVDVRLWAAAHSLKWAPDRAAEVLREIRDAEGLGLRSVSAKWTLRQWEKGELSFEYDL